MNVSLSDWLTIAAILIGPIMAVQAQRFLESLRDRRNRRLAVFHTLMATRAARLSHLHVQALNQIDIEFYGRRALGIRIQTPAEKRVTNAWRVYSDHLNNRYPEGEFARWIEDGDKQLAKLLFEMSRALGYDFDEVELRRNVYSPVAHGKLEAQDAAIREGLERLLTNKSGLAIVGFEPSSAPIAPAQSEPSISPASIPPLNPPPGDGAT
jgi:hypothetical protein